MTIDASILRPPPADVVTAYRAQGFWTDDSLGDVVSAGLQAAAGERFTAHSAVHPWSGTLGDVDLAARRLAAVLRARGVGAGDVVAMQLPNWAEAGITFWAAAYLGAVVVPIVHFYGPKEVGYILDVTDPKVIVSADQFGRSDFLATYDELLRHRPDTRWLVVRATSRPLPTRAADFAEAFDGEPLTSLPRVDPDAPAVIGFTSGTTRNPKGVVHSHRTIGFEARQLDVVANPCPTVTGTPVGHFMGMLSAFLLPLVRPKAVNLIDLWDPAQVLQIMTAEKIGAGGGATFFLTSLLDHPDFGPEHRALMPYIPLGGAPVPAAVARRAAKLGIRISRSYGSTEHPSITGTAPSEPDDKHLLTDGRPLRGVELRLDDEGEILTRGPDRFLGYTDPQLTAAAIDADGWYHTGDVGTLDPTGYLTITDRLSDIIIRGGENISAGEVEDVLVHMTQIAEVSVVSAPDDRLGEHVAAVLRLHPDATAPNRTQIRDHLTASGLARQKWPESIYLVTELPRTASGKVQKARLRDQVRSGALRPVDS